MWYLNVGLDAMSDDVSSSILRSNPKIHAGPSALCSANMGSAPAYIAVSSTRTPDRALAIVRALLRFLVQVASSLQPSNPTANMGMVSGGSVPANTPTFRLSFESAFAFSTTSCHWGLRLDFTSIAQHTLSARYRRAELP